MDKYPVQIAGEANEDILSSGTFLILYHASSIPPHIILVSEEKYYSLSVRGSEIGEPVSKLLRRIRQTSASVLFIGIKIPSSKVSPSEYFIRYKEPKEGIVSCLQPIKEFISDCTGISLIDCGFVFELYNLLQKHELVSESYQLNLEKHISSEEIFFMKTYSSDAIDKCISQNRIKSESEC